MMTGGARWVLGVLIGVWLSSVGPLLAAGGQEQEPGVKSSVVGQLNAILLDLESRKRELAAKKKLLDKKGNEQEQGVIQADIKEMTEAIEEQQRAFEQIVTGGRELNKLIKRQEKPFDWQKDLLEILEPVLIELRAMTADLRKNEILKNRITLYGEQSKVIRQALENINAFATDGLSPAASQQVAAIKKVWSDQLKEYTHRQDVTQLQLDERLRQAALTQGSFMDELGKVALGRVATLLMALAVAMAVYLLLHGLLRVLRLLFGRDLSGKMLTYQRLMGIVLRFVVLLLSLSAAYYVFVLRGDQVLQGLTILLLLVALLIVKNSAPRFLEELKLMLNIGSVREGERLLYLGVPWKVERLGVDCLLSNPLVGVGSLLVPVRSLLALESRAFHPDEAWFPCRMGDWVVLGDGTFGQVRMISPDGVVLNSAGSSMFLTMAGFLGSKPRCLSEGFKLGIPFGVDYRHQSIATTEIPLGLQQGIESRLQADPDLAVFLKEIKVQFATANVSSLDYMILTAFHGDAACFWPVIPRVVQRCAVEVCNEAGWEIPFTQMRLHLPAGVGATMDQEPSR